jgi:hypothetical protein
MVLVLQCVCHQELQCSWGTAIVNTILLLFSSTSSVGCDNFVGDNLFQIALQVDMIVECTFEGAVQ